MSAQRRQKNTKFGPITLRRGDVFVVGLRWRDDDAKLTADSVAAMANPDDHRVLDLGYQLRMRFNPIRQTIMVLPKGTTRDQVADAIEALTPDEQRALWANAKGPL